MKKLIQLLLIFLAAIGISVFLLYGAGLRPE